ncbi:hypothetical protein TWF506_002328 [Arthrobotrys conoides]|uniref:Uncharacterized protein n=1 Tax=Arthrobotrys conoides TaxID=74498 RepID=A0AAN8RUQ6_9PEZI
MSSRGGSRNPSSLGHLDVTADREKGPNFPDVSVRMYWYTGRDRRTNKRCRRRASRVEYEERYDHNISFTSILKLYIVLFPKTAIMYFPIVALLSLAGTALAVPVANAVDSAPCTTVIRVAPHFDLSPTLTVYQTTVTAYSAVECDGCVLKTEVLPWGPGPVVIRTATATVGTTTEYAFQCQPTPA